MWEYCQNIWKDVNSILEVFQQSCNVHCKYDVYDIFTELLNNQC